MNAIRAPKKPAPQDWHPADIKAALEKAGWSLRQLALKHGYCGHFFGSCLKKPHFNAQQIIADALGVAPQTIWPSRYDAQGQPIRANPWIPIKRPACWAKPHQKRTNKDTGLGGGRNGSAGAEG